MIRKLHPLILPLAALWVCLASFALRAQENERSAEPPAQPPAAEAPEESASDERESSRTEEAIGEDIGERIERRIERRLRARHRDNAIIHFGDDSHLPADREADEVVAIFGSATAEGTVHDNVISIFGNTRATGPVGRSAVAVFGDVYVNGTVGEDVVAVMGNVELGPEADVDGQVVAVGGQLVKQPGAYVRGDEQEIAIAAGWLKAESARTWVEQCLLLMRPLAFEPNLGWAWGIAFAFLAFYIVVTLMFGSAVERCVQTLEQRPGQSFVTSILSVLVTPAVFLLLAISVIGLLLVPFVATILFGAVLFGKAVVLAALGRRVTRFTGIAPINHLAFAVFVGGLIVLVLYVIPVVGFIAYKLLGILGFGVVAYTMLLTLQDRRARAEPAVAQATAAAGPGPGAAFSPGPGAAPAPEAPASAESSAGTTAEAGPQAGTTAEAHAEAAAPQAGAPAPATAAIDVTTLPRAGFWIRMGALLIDVILVAVLLEILSPFGDIMLVALGVYGALMWKLRGTTVGGIVFGLKVVRQDGREMSWDTAIVRALSCFLSLVVAGLGFFWIAFDPERQAWHDKIAGTLVVRAPKGSALL
ncbi:MAG TPA: RDD family protein [Steroidobacteraceae bacterium]